MVHPSPMLDETCRPEYARLFTVYTFGGYPAFPGEGDEPP